MNDKRGALFIQFHAIGATRPATAVAVIGWLVPSPSCALVCIFPHPAVDYQG